MNPTMPVLLWPPCGGSILDKYEVRLMNQALQDLDEIYGYIASNLQEAGCCLGIAGCAGIRNLVIRVSAISMLGASDRLFCKQRVSAAHGKELHCHLPN